MKKLTILFTLLFCVTLSGCGQSASPQNNESTQEPSSTAVTAPEDTASTDKSGETASSSGESGESTDSKPSASEHTATLYIGTKSKGFAEYPMTYTGELTPEALIQGIAGLTGWNLTLAEPVTSGKGGMSVCFSTGSTLFLGPPENQKEEFFMFDSNDLAETLLDSIQKTLQEGFTLEGGNPDALDIWYFMEGDQPLELPNIGMSWPIDKPYQWSEAQTAES